jgi:hypothetical protein
MSNIRTGKDGEFELSMSRVSICRRMNRATVKNSLNALEDMGLIEIGDSKCTVNAARYASLIIAYVNLEKAEDRKTFQSMLSDGDYRGLKSLGYQEGIENEDVFLNQRGGSNLLKIEQVSNIVQVKDDELFNIKQVENEDLSNFKQVHDNSLLNFKHLLNIVQVDLLKIKQSYDTCLKLSTLLPLFDRGLMKQVVEEGMKNGLKEHMLFKIKQVIPEISKDEVFSICLDRYCSCDPDVFGDVTNPWVLNFDHLAAQFYTGGCLKLSTSNNINNIIKKNELDERSESSNKEEKTEETNLGDKNYKKLMFKSRKGLEGNNDDNSQIEEKYSGEGLGKGLGEDNDNINSQPEEENIEGVRVEEVKEEVEEGFDPAKRAILDNVNVAHLKNVEKNRIKSRTPFFPPNEIEDIIRNIESCLDRPDKLFINRFWDIVFESEIETDEDLEKDDKEDGNEERPVKDIFDDMEGWKIDCYSNVTANYLRQAYDEVQEAFDKGYIETENKRLSVNFKEMLPPESVEIILGFEVYRNAGREYHIISAKMIRDITRALPELVDVSKLTREERSKKKRDDLLYLQKIISMAMYDDEYEKLTPVEKEVYLFMDKFFIIDFDNIDWEPNDETQIITSVNSSSIRPNNLSFFMSKMSCCTESEFIDLTTMGRDDCGNHEISQKRVFYADKIRDLNAMRGFESVVDSFEVDLKPLY